MEGGGGWVDGWWVREYILVEPSGSMVTIFRKRLIKSHIYLNMGELIYLFSKYILFWNK